MANARSKAKGGDRLQSIQVSVSEISGFPQIEQRFPGSARRVSSCSRQGRHSPYHASSARSRALLQQAQFVGNSLSRSSAAPRAKELVFIEERILIPI
jgi:hypothetical protein